MYIYIYIYIYMYIYIYIYVYMVIHENMFECLIYLFVCVCVPIFC